MPQMKVFIFTSARNKTYFLIFMIKIIYKHNVKGCLYCKYPFAYEQSRIINVIFGYFCTRAKLRKLPANRKLLGMYCNFLFILCDRISKKA
jgi:hypothetical protein